MIVLLPEGEMVSRAYPETEKEVAEEMSAGRTKVMLNMERVGFIDSAGIIFLLRLKNIVASRGGCLIVYNGQRNVESTLIKSKLEKVLNISKDAEQCLIDIWYMAGDESRVPMLKRYGDKNRMTRETAPSV